MIFFIYTAENTVRIFEFFVKILVNLVFNNLDNHSKNVDEIPKKQGKFIKKFKELIWKPKDFLGFR